jgi:hypothetical protein
VGLSSTTRWIIIGAAGLWVVLAFAVALYGSSRGHPFFPLLVCALLPVPGWPLVLLAAAVAPRQPRRNEVEERFYEYEPAPAAARERFGTSETRQLPVVPPPRQGR